MATHHLKDQDSMLRVSVIIPAHNDHDRLKLCLAALAEQTLPRESYEVIVVDNRSDPPLRDVVEQFDFCSYTTESKPGSYAARNKGLQLAKADLLAFTDSDCIPEPQWLEKGCEALKRLAPDGLIGGRIKVFSQNADKPTSVELYEFAFAFDQASNISKARFAATANMFTARETIEAVGPFNQELKSGGDLEWGRRVSTAGRSLAYAEDVVIRHPSRHSIKQINIKTRRHVGGHYGISKQRRDRLFTLHKLNVLWKLICPQFGKMWEARKRLGRLGFGFVAWLRVCMVILVIQYTKLFEYFRLYLGGNAEHR